MIVSDRPQLAEEHALDVLEALIGWDAAGKATALAVLTGTEGGAVRAPGALMAVSEHGASAGYLSGGCIDADLVLQAQSVIRTCAARTLRYGSGSPFVDIQLPCGGALDVLICPIRDTGELKTAAKALRGRRPARLSFDPDGRIGSPATSQITTRALTHTFEPKLRLRLAGRGADFVALARLAVASGIDCQVQSPDESDLNALTGLHADRLYTPNTPADISDDRWTAFVLMFHDRDWELALLEQALASGAFFVGAVGSRATHAKRCADLAERGVLPADIARIRAPIGLVPRMRDASMLAVSALAEIVQVFHERTD